jgi:hypothetical protein
MNKILLAITETLLVLLKKRGVDVSVLRPLTKKEKQIELLSNRLYDLQANISIKRAELVETQKNLIVKMEPIVFNVLSETDDSWQKTTMTKIWMDDLTEINNKIDEHEELLNLFENTYYNLENTKNGI